MAEAKTKKKRVLRALNDCRWPNCSVQATHGLAGGWRPFYCGTHAAPLPLLEPVAIRTCSECTAAATHATDKKELPTLCERHAVGDAVKTALAMCACCTKRVMYGPPDVEPGESFAVLCATHGKALEGWSNIVTSAKHYCVCGTLAWFGPPDAPNLRCAKHALPGDISHNAKPRCIMCGKDASFLAAGETEHKKSKALYCLEHKEAGSVSVANYICTGCDKYAVKAKEDLCAQCAKEIPKEHRRSITRGGETKGVPLLRITGDAGEVAEALAAGQAIGHADGVGYACHASGCDKHAFFGVADSKTHCATHKPAGAVMLKTLSWCTKCLDDGGRRRLASFTHTIGRTPTRCATHATVDMIDAHLRYLCQGKDCGKCPVRKNQQLCINCRERDPRFKEAETAVENVLNATELAEFLVLRDEAVPCRPAGVPAFRPDFGWRLPDRVVILEVDENAHRYYDPSCEVARLRQIHESINLSTPAGVPKPAMLVLRYNPHTPEHAADKHARVPDMVRALFTCPLPERSWSVEYAGYAAADVADLEATEREMERVAYAFRKGGELRITDGDAIYVDDVRVAMVDTEDGSETDEEAPAAAGAGAGAGAGAVAGHKRPMGHSVGSAAAKRIKA